MNIDELILIKMNSAVYSCWWQQMNADECQRIQIKADKLGWMQMYAEGCLINIWDSVFHFFVNLSFCKPKNQKKLQLTLGCEDCAEGANI